MPPGPGLPSSRASGAAGSCYNMVYAFTCVPPPGFSITSESSGPGKVLTLVKRSQTTQEEDNLTLRVYPLRGALERFAQRRIVEAAEKAPGVQDIQRGPARLGERDGYSVAYRREYANGAFDTRFFCFERASQVYVVEHTVPAGRPRKGADPLESFVSSLNFR